MLQGGLPSTSCAPGSPPSAGAQLTLRLPPVPARCPPAGQDTLSVSTGTVDTPIALGARPSPAGRPPLSARLLCRGLPVRSTLSLCKSPQFWVLWSRLNSAQSQSPLPHLGLRHPLFRLVPRSRGLSQGSAVARPAPLHRHCSGPHPYPFTSHSSVRSSRCPVSTQLFPERWGLPGCCPRLWQPSPRLCQGHPFVSGAFIAAHSRIVTPSWTCPLSPDQLVP